MNAYLLGFRGAGKTTVGRMLAAQLGWGFLDLDEEWETREGRTIVSFVQDRGEPAFRESEEVILREVEESFRPGGARERGGWLVATGGGVVDSPSSREILVSSPWPKIFLSVEESELWDRLRNSEERKKIGQLNSQAALAERLRQRLPHYEKIATYRVANRDISQSLAELNRLLAHGQKD